MGHVLWDHLSTAAFIKDGHCSLHLFIHVTFKDDLFKQTEHLVNDQPLKKMLKPHFSKS